MPEPVRNFCRPELVSRIRHRHWTRGEGAAMCCTLSILPGPGLCL